MNASLYNPALHHRRSIRLQGYDYAQAGLYFITICIQNRRCLLGAVANGTMIQNSAGSSIEGWYLELENKFRDIRCHAHIVIPNHFHCIIENTGAAAAAAVRANLCVRPSVRPADRPLDRPPDPGETAGNILDENAGGVSGEHGGSPLHRVVQWFKTMTTNEYIRNVKNANWPPYDGKLWQRNYYEHIIRNERSYNHIHNYILNNPAKWPADKFHTH